jgi:hypothetical protein
MHQLFTRLWCQGEVAADATVDTDFRVVRDELQGWPVTGNRQEAWRDSRVVSETLSLLVFGSWM